MAETGHFGLSETDICQAAHVIADLIFIVQSCAPLSCEYIAIACLASRGRFRRV